MCTIYIYIVRNYLDVTFVEQWIGRGDSPGCWTVRSPDLPCLDFYFKGHIRTLAYDTPVDSAEELVARTSVVAREIRNMPEVFQNLQISMRRRCEVRFVAGGRNFGLLL